MLITDINVTAGKNLPQKLRVWMSSGSEPYSVDRRDGASVRIAIGPDGSWIAFDGMFAFN
jgi:hypothetical protein